MIRTPKPAPRCDTSENSVAMLVIANAGAATVDLAQQDTYPAWSPQRLTVTNGDVSSLNVVLIDEDGVTHTIAVPAAGVIVINRPIRTIDTSSETAQVIAEWFDPNGSNAWNT